LRSLLLVLLETIDNARLETMQDKTRQDPTRQHKTTQQKTRQDKSKTKTRQDDPTWSWSRSWSWSCQRSWSWSSFLVLLVLDLDLVLVLVFLVLVFDSHCFALVFNSSSARLYKTSTCLFLLLLMTRCVFFLFWLCLRTFLSVCGDQESRSQDQDHTTKVTKSQDRDNHGVQGALHRAMSVMSCYNDWNCELPFVCAFFVFFRLFGLLVCNVPVLSACLLRIFLVLCFVSPNLFISLSIFWPSCVFVHR
jgi:hypothetical protein